MKQVDKKKANKNGLTPGMIGNYDFYFLALE